MFGLWSLSFPNFLCFVLIPSLSEMGSMSGIWLPVSTINVTTASACSFWFHEGDQCSQLQENRKQVINYLQVLWWSNGHCQQLNHRKIELTCDTCGRYCKVFIIFHIIHPHKSNSQKPFDLFIWPPYDCGQLDPFLIYSMSSTNTRHDYYMHEWDTKRSPWQYCEDHRIQQHKKSLRTLLMPPNADGMLGFLRWWIASLSSPDFSVVASSYCCEYNISGYVLVHAGVYS